MLRILQLEDDPVDSQLALRLLREGGLEVEIDRVHTFAAFKRMLEQNPPALILADYTVPGVDVFRAFQLARQLCGEVPFVFLSGTLGEDVAIETLKMGATDYVLKQRIGRLVPAVRRALQEARLQRQRQQAEQELRESEGRYRALVELAPDAVVVCQDWRFVYVNAAALRLCGAEALEEMWDKEIFQFIPFEEQETARDLGQRLLQGAAVALRETRLRRLDGQEVPVEVTGTRVEWLGQPALQAILRDITEHKRIEQELQDAKQQLLQANANLEQTVRERTAELREAVEDLHRFSYTIIHDMRAPLRAMHCFATLMQERSASEAPARNREFLRRIQTAAERLDNLIQDALDYAKILQEKGSLEPVDLDHLLRGIIDSYPDLQRSVAEIRIEGSIPAVLGSEAALTQCFSNLLGNAVKFVAPGIRPYVRVRAEALAPQPGTRPDEPSAPFVRIWVEDNGIGIPQEYQTHIFEMFHRLDNQHEGTGVGLAIVRKAVERLGGRVGVESTPGVGSKFWIDLRRPDPHPDEARGHADPANPLKGNARGTPV